MRVVAGGALVGGGDGDGVGQVLSTCCPRRPRRSKPLGPDVAGDAELEADDDAGYGGAVA